MLVRGLQGVRAHCARRSNGGTRRNAATESEMETLLFQALREHDLPEPVLQYEVLDRNGVFVARADAALPGVEDRDRVRQSMQEHLGRVPARARRRRRNRIIAAGYVPLIARIGDLRRGRRRARRGDPRDRAPNRRTGVRSGVT